MNISDVGLEALIMEEGKKNTAYQDSKGVWTIGVGHTGKVAGKSIHEGMKITNEQMINLLKSDIRLTEATINRFVKVDLSQQQYDALVSLVFNIGTTNFLRSTVLARINSRAKIDEILTAIQMWKRAGKRKNILLKRRQRECKIYADGIYRTSKGEVCL